MARPFLSNLANSCEFHPSGCHTYSLNSSADARYSLDGVMFTLKPVEMYDT